ncbi:MAG TPA: VOC family protein [Actinomycetota bacterium]|jgi:predicted enzyme related to lactoylglutathione lyase|nr:VOC family protein [Actinomycetota bacterium]
MTSKFTELSVDCRDPDTVATFWSEVLGYEKKMEDDIVFLQGPAGSGPTIAFVKVPEEKVVKNRLHIDVNPTDRDQQEEVERLEKLGATHVDVGQGKVSWVVMADPEGNEFCVLRSRVST